MLLDECFYIGIIIQIMIKIAQILLLAAYPTTLYCPYNR